MTTKTSPDAPDFIPDAAKAAEVAPDEWVQVSEDEVAETKLTFDRMNEPFTGTYIGSRVIDGDEHKFFQYRFENEGFYYFVNGNWSLSQGMKSVRKGQRVRVTWIAEKDTGQLTPMRVYKVEIARVRIPSSVRTAMTPE